jgi:hypothetical protein
MTGHVPDQYSRLLLQCRAGAALQRYRFSGGAARGVKGRSGGIAVQGSSHQTAADARHNTVKCVSRRLVGHQARYSPTWYSILMNLAAKESLIRHLASNVSTVAITFYNVAI